MKPPPFIDGARVVAWAWSGETPFGYVPGADPSEAIFGLAITIYDKSRTIYWFSCDARWETVQDSICDSIDDARDLVPSQYRLAPIHWNSYVQDSEQAENEN